MNKGMWRKVLCMGIALAMLLTGVCALAEEWEIVVIAKNAES